MAKFSAIKNTLQNGELSDKLVGRTDLNEYKNGCKLLQNFVPYTSGGVYKLPGSRYVPLKFSNGNADTFTDDIERGLIPFTDLNRTPFIIEVNRVAVINSGSGNLGDRLVVNIRGADGQAIFTQSLFNFVYDFPEGIGNGWCWVQTGTTLVVCHNSGRVPPFYVVKLGDQFKVVQLLLAKIGGPFSGIPSVPADYLRIPYDNESFDADRVFKTNTLAAGAAIAEMVDSGGNPVQFFRSYLLPGGPWRLANDYYVRVNISNNSGVFQGGAAFAPDLLASSVTVATDTINIPGHLFSNYDKVQLEIGQYSLGGGAGTLPSPLVANTTYYVIKVDANNIKLAASPADVLAGTPIDLTDQGANHFNIIGTFTSKSSGNILLAMPTGTTTGLTSWQLGQWSYDQGWPSVVTSFDERVIFMGSPAFTDSVWNSRKGNIYHFMQSKLRQDSTNDVSGNNYFGALSSVDAFSYLPASSEVGRITWASSQRSLFIGTDYSEFAVSRVDGVYGPPTQFSILPQTYHGAAPVRSARQGNTTLFVSRDGKKVRDFRYSDNNGSNISRNLSILADQIHAHNFVSGDFNGINFVTMSWQEAASTLWLLTSIGQVVSLTLDDSGQAAGWARHNFNGTVKSIITLPSSNGDWDNVWMIIQRGSKFYLEYITEPFEHLTYVNSSTNPSDLPVYLHSAIYIDQASSTAVSGLSHLEGEEVFCLADGVKQGPFTVASGAITLPVAAEKIIVGLPYVSKLQTLPLEAGSIIGSSQILLKRVEQVLIKLYKSSGGQIAYGSRKYDLQYKGAVSGQPFTGDIDQPYHSTNAKDYRIDIEHSDPTPFNLLAIVMRGNTED